METPSSYFSKLKSLTRLVVGGYTEQTKYSDLCDYVRVSCKGDEESASPYNLENLRP